MPKAPTVDVWGIGPLAEATLVAARSLGWQAEPGSVGADSGRDVIAVAPLAPSVAACDELIAHRHTGHRACAWPMISVTAVQEMVARCHRLGALTDLSTRSTRPTRSRPGQNEDLATTLLAAAHDQVALLVVLARVAGHGPPTAVSMPTVQQQAVRLIIHFEDVEASVQIAWDDTATQSLDMQVAGVAGVLRIETDPETQLEHNGEAVILPTPPPIDPQLVALRDAGVIAMLQTIGASFVDGRPLAYAFSFEFGRSVVAVFEAAVLSAGRSGAPIPLSD